VPRLLKDQRRVVELLSTGLTRTEACRRAGMSRGTFYYWLHRSPAFRAAVLEAAMRSGPATGRSGAQWCRSCGLVLSAQATFCRRCGAFQNEPLAHLTTRNESLGLPADTPASVVLPEWAAILLLTVSLSALLTFLFVLPGT